MKKRGYQNYPRFCPQCGESFYRNMELKWFPRIKHDTLYTCKNCGLQIHGIHKPENYLMYGKPVSIIKLWKWEVIEKSINPNVIPKQTI